jgi:endonuclease YncB( thermonuclease family)
MKQSTLRKEPVMTKKSVILIFIGLLLLAAPATAGGNTGTVTKVLEGDLVCIGDSFVVRFTGVAAPGAGDALGAEVFAFTKKELEGKLVKLFTWTTDNTAAGIVLDDEGHASIQILYGKEFSISFNELLLEKGFARVEEERLPDDLAERYRELEKAAREQGLGIWGNKE